jgi:hypothetical protein
MGVLAEFVRKEAEHLRGESHRREAVLKEWLLAVAQLTDQLRQWVTDADGGIGLLQAEGGQQYTRQEAMLGVYTITSLSITLGGRFSGRWAEVLPRSRYVAAVIKPPGEEPRRADGMVEIRDGSTAEYYLFRLGGSDPEHDRWFIRSVAEWNADPDYGHVDELTQDRFEAAILRILK